MDMFIAGVQYGDWRGSAKADDADAHLASIRRYMQQKGLMQSGHFLVGFRMWNGENGRNLPGADKARLAPARVTAFFVPARDYEEALAYLKKHDPVPVTTVRFQMDMNDFFMLFKRFSVALAWSDLPFNDREFEVTAESEESDARDDDE